MTGTCAGLPVGFGNEGLIADTANWWLNFIASIEPIVESQEVKDRPKREAQEVDVSPPPKRAKATPKSRKVVQQDTNELLLTEKEKQQYRRFILEGIHSKISMKTPLTGTYTLAMPEKVYRFVVGSPKLELTGEPEVDSFFGKPSFKYEGSGGDLSTKHHLVSLKFSYFKQSMLKSPV